MTSNTPKAQVIHFQNKDGTTCYLIPRPIKWYIRIIKISFRSQLVVQKFARSFNVCLIHLTEKFLCFLYKKAKMNVLI